MRIADISAYYYQCFKTIGLKLDVANIEHAAQATEGSPSSFTSCFSVKAAAFSSCLLSLIERPVRVSKEPGHVVRLISICGADADGSPGQAVGGLVQCGIDHPNFLLDQILPQALGAAHQHGELIAADSADIVIRTERPSKQFCDVFQHAVTDLMSITVVDRLESVNIHQQQQRQRVQVCLGNHLLISRPVVKPREGIVLCQVGQQALGP